MNVESYVPEAAYGPLLAIHHPIQVVSHNPPPHVPPVLKVGHIIWLIILMFPYHIVKACSKFGPDCFGDSSSVSFKYADLKYVEDSGSNYVIKSMI